MSLILPEEILQNEAVDIDRSLRVKAKQADDKLKQMIRNKAGEEQINDFLQSSYVHPQKRIITSNSKQSLSNQNQIGILKRKLSSSEKENEKLHSLIDETDAHKEKLEEQLFDCMRQLETLSEKSQNYEDVSKLEKELQEKATKIDELTRKLSSTNVRNLNKKIKTRDSSILQLKDTNKECKIRLEQTEHQLKQRDQENEQLNKCLENSLVSKRKLQRQVSYYKMKNTKLINSSITDLENELASNSAKIEELSQENKELQDMINFVNDTDKLVTTFHQGKYTDNVREVYMRLQSLNVGRRNIEKVIRTVLTKLAGVDIDRLPSEALTSRLFCEAKILADIQAANALLADGPNNTIHYDETTKFGDRSGSVQATTSSGTYVLGLFEMECGESKHLFSQVKQTFIDLANTLTSAKTDSDPSVLNKLLFSFRNTMTDRHVTNSCVDKMLEEWRTELAPTLYDNFNSMSDEAKIQITHVNSFRCNLHFLLGLANEANTALQKLDKISNLTDTAEFKIDARMIIDSEAGAVRTIRTVCKAFEKHGSEEAGVTASFKAFINCECRLQPFKGNRFNILFRNGGAVFYHRNNFTRYFECFGTPNRLLRAVKIDLGIISNIAGCRALGIVDKLITGPFS